jgi:UDP-N-acetylglucosamine transferase subunit ALG13
MSARRQPLVIVTVGGDHHPFERLMRWVENWLLDEQPDVRCFVQYGAARLPHGAEGAAYLDHQELLDLINDARAVVSSGGPATLSEARLAGHRPLAVPRLSALGEVVDDHQRSFTQRLHERGAIVQVEDEQTFRAAIASAIDAPRLIPTARTSPESVRLVGKLIDATAGWIDLTELDSRIDPSRTTVRL